MRVFKAIDYLKYADDPDALVFGPPLSDEALDGIDKELGVTMPAEFREAYKMHDGIGTKQADGWIDWFFVPAADLSKLADTTREWFEETHPEIASKFVPFVNEGDGDASGFLFIGNCSSPTPIYTFEHASYDFDDSQPWQEFLVRVSSSIYEFPFA